MMASGTLVGWASEALKEALIAWYNALQPDCVVKSICELKDGEALYNLLTLISNDSSRRGVPARPCARFSRIDTFIKSVLSIGSIYTLNISTILNHGDEQELAKALLMLLFIGSLDNADFVSAATALDMCHQEALHLILQQVQVKPVSVSSDIPARVATPPALSPRRSSRITSSGSSAGTQSPLALLLNSPFTLESRQNIYVKMRKQEVILATAEDEKNQLRLDLESKIQQLESKVSSQRDQISELQSIISNSYSESEYRTLEQELERLRPRLETLQQKEELVLELEERLFTVQRQSDEDEALISRFKQQNTQLLEERDATGLANEALEKDLSRLRQEHATILAMLSETREALVYKQAECGSLMNMVKEHSTPQALPTFEGEKLGDVLLMEAHAENQVLHDKIFSQAKELNDLVVELKGVREVLEHSSDECRNLKEQLDQSQNLVQQTKADYEVVSLSALTTESDLRGCKQLISTQKEKIQCLELELAECKCACDRQGEAFKIENTNLKESYDSVRQKLDLMHAESEVLHIQDASLQQQMVIMEADKRELLGKMELLQSQSKELKVDLESVQLQTRKAENERDSLLCMVEALHSDIRLLNDQKNSMETDRNEIVNCLEKEKAELMTELQGLKTQCFRLEEKCEIEAQKVNHLNQQIAEINKEAVVTKELHQTQLQDVMEEKHELMVKIQVLETASSKLIAELQQSSLNAGDLRSKLCAIEEEKIACLTVCEKQQMEIETLQSQSLTQQQEYSASIERLMQDKNDLNIEKSHLEAKLLKLEVKILNLTTQYECAESFKKQLESELSLLRQETHSVTSQLAASKLEMEGMTEGKLQLLLEIETLRCQHLEIVQRGEHQQLLIGDLRTDLDHLLLQKVKVEEENKQQGLLIDQLRLQLQLLQTETQDFSAQRDKQLTEISDLRCQLAKCQDDAALTIAQLQHSVNEYLLDKSCQKEQLSLLQAEITLLSAKNEHNETFVKRLEDELLVSQQETASVTSHFEKSQREMVDMVNEKVLLQSNIEALEFAKSHILNEIQLQTLQNQKFSEELQEAVLEKEALWKTSDLEVSNLNLKIQQITSKYDISCSEVIQLQMRLDELQRACDTVTMKLNESQHVLRQTQNSHTADVACWQTEKSQFVSHLGQSEEVVAELRHSVEVLDRELVALKDENGLLRVELSEGKSKFQREIQSLTEEKNDYCSRLEILSREARELERQLSLQNQELDALGELFKKASADHLEQTAHHNAQLISLEASYKKIEAEIQNYEVSNMQLQNNLLLIKEENSELLSQLKIVHMDASKMILNQEELSSELQAQRAAYSSLLLEKETNEQQCHNLRKQFEDQINEIAEMKTYHSAEINLLRDEKKDMVSKLENSKSEIEESKLKADQVSEQLLSTMNILECNKVQKQQAECLVETLQRSVDTELAESLAKQQVLSLQVTDLQSTILAQRQEIESLKIELERINLECMQKTTMYEEMEKEQLKMSQAESAKIQSLEIEYASQVQSQAQEIASLMNEMNRVREEHCLAVTSYEERMVQANIINDALKGQITTSEIHQRKLEDDLSLARQSSEDMHNQVNRMMDEMNSLQNKNVNLEGENVDLVNSLKTSTAQAQAFVSELNLLRETLAAKTGEIDCINLELQKSRQSSTRMQELELSNSMLQRHVDEIESSRRNAESEIATVKQENVDLTSQLEEVTAESENLIAQLDTLQNETHSLHTHLSSLRSEIVECEERHRHDILSLKEHIENMTSDQDAARSVIFASMGAVEELQRTMMRVIQDATVESMGIKREPECTDVASPVTDDCMVGRDVVQNEPVNCDEVSSPYIVVHVKCLSRKLEMLKDYTHSVFSIVYCLSKKMGEIEGTLQTELAFRESLSDTESASHAKIETLNAKCEELEAQLQDSMMRLESTSTEKLALVNDAKKTQLSLSQLEMDIVKLTIQLQDAYDTISTTTAELKTVESKNASFFEELSKLKDLNHRLTIQLEEKTSVQTRLLCESDSQLTELKDQLAEKCSQIELLQSAIKHFTGLKEAKEQAENALSETRTEIETLQSTVLKHAGLEEAKERAEKELLEIRNRLSSGELVPGSLLIEVEARCITLEEVNTSLNSKLEKMKESFNKQIENYIEQIKSRQEHSDSMTSKVAEMSEQLDVRTAECTKLRQIVKEKEDILSRYQVYYKEKKARIVELEHELKLAKAQLAKLHGDLEKAKADANAMLEIKNMIGEMNRVNDKNALQTIQESLTNDPPLTMGELTDGSDQPVFERRASRRLSLEQSSRRLSVAGVGPAFGYGDMEGNVLEETELKNTIKNLAPQAEMASSLFPQLSLRDVPDENAQDRIDEMKRRNAKYLPHLRSAYPAETQAYSPSRAPEDDIREGRGSSAPDAESTLIQSPTADEKRQSKRLSQTVTRQSPKRPRGGTVALKMYQLPLIDRSINIPGMETRVKTPSKTPNKTPKGKGLGPKSEITAPLTFEILNTPKDKKKTLKDKMKDKFKR